MRLSAGEAYEKYADRVFAAVMALPERYRTAIHLFYCEELSVAEIVEQLDTLEVEYGEDGTVTVWWRSKGLDITDKFEDGVCYVQLVDGGETKYLTVKYQNGYACSDTAYISPSAFNTWPAGTGVG